MVTKNINIEEHISMSKIRTRFAPSPTGRMHVGNLRTALYAYLIAKHEGGDFILRIEDTDQVRQVEGAVDIINRTLEETGLVHDEGPDKDGGCGPYVQSERVAQGIYMKYAKELIDKLQARKSLSMTSTAYTCQRRRLRQILRPASHMLSDRTILQRAQPHLRMRFTEISQWIMQSLMI